MRLAQTVRCDAPVGAEAALATFNFLVATLRMAKHPACPLLSANAAAVEQWLAIPPRRPPATCNNVGFQIGSTEADMKTIKVQLIGALACLALSGGAFAQGAGGGGGGTGGGSGGAGGGGGTGMSAPNSGGQTATESTAQGANTMGNSGASSKKMQHRKASHPKAASME